MFTLCKLNLVYSFLFCKCRKCVFQRFNLLSISIHNNLVDILWLILHHLYLIQIYLGFFWSLWSFIEIYLDLLSCHFFLTNLVQFHIRFVKVSKSSVKSILPTFIVLPSAKFASSAYLKAHSKIWDNLWHLKVFKKD